MSNFKPPDRKKVRRRKRKKISTDEYVYVGGTKKLPPNPEDSADIEISIKINLN